MRRADLPVAILDRKAIPVARGMPPEPAPRMARALHQVDCPARSQLVCAALLAEAMQLV